MSIRRFKFGNEDASVVEDAPIAPEVQEQIEVAAGSETAPVVAEVTEDLQEAEAADAALEEMEGDTKVIEQLVDNAEESVEEGGMPQVAARATDIAVEAYARKYDLQYRKSASTALENFGGTSTRLRATKAAVEEGRNLLQRGWDAFVAFLKRIKDFLLSIWAKLTGAATGMDKRAAAILEKANKATSVVKEVKKPGLAQKLSIDGKANEKQILDNLKETDKTLTSVADVFYKNIAGAESAIKFSDIEEDKKAIKALQKKASDLFKQFLGVDAGEHELEIMGVKDGYGKFLGPILPGEKAMVVAYEKEDGVDVVSKVKVITLNKTPDAREVLPGMSLKGIKELCDIVQNMSKNRARLDDDVKKLSKLGDTLVNKVKSIKWKSDEKSTDNSKLRADLTSYIKNNFDPFIAYAGQSLRSSNAALDWASASLKQKDADGEKTK